MTRQKECDTCMLRAEEIGRAMTHCAVLEDRIARMEAMAEAGKRAIATNRILQGRLAELELEVARLRVERQPTEGLA